MLFSSMAKKKIPKKKEKVREIFEVEKDGKEKIIETDSTSETLVEKPGQKKHQAKLLGIILLVLVGIIGLVIGGYYYFDSLRYSEYEGIQFTTISEGDLIFYKTSIPVQYQGNLVPYFFYIRTHPSKLKKIDFDNSDFNLMKFAVLNMPSDIKCNDGDEIIAIANLKKMHEVFGINIMKDDTASCDDAGRYSYYNVMESDETKIEKIGTNCYNIHVSDCEILPATEKLMVEMLIDYSKE